MASAPDFPSILPRPLLTGQTHTITNPVITTPSDSGQPMVRQRFTAVPEIRSYVLHLIGKNAVDAFKKHYALAHYGGAFFEMETDDYGTITKQRVRYQGVYDINPRGAGRWQASFSVLIEEQNLITDAEYTTITGTPIAPPAGVPRFTSFAITGWHSNIVAGTNVGGTQTISFTMEHPDEMAGNLTLWVTSGGSTRAVAAGITPGANRSQRIGLGDIILNSGDTASAYLQGVSKTGATVRSVAATASVRNLNELVYFGTKTTRTFVSGDAANFQSARWQAGPQTLAYPAWTGDRYLIYAQLSTRNDITQVEQVGAGVFGNITDTFEKQPNTATISGQQYEWWASAYQARSASFPQGVSLIITK